MTNYTTILWDLDGTIIDSAPGVFESFHYTFKTLGLPDVDDETLRTFMGPPLSDTFSKTLGFDAALTEKCLFTYRDYYLNQGGALNCTLYPGVLEVIAKSQAAGVTNSLATSKGESGTILVGEHYDFLKHFDVLGTASNDRSRSVKADVISYAYEELKKIDADLSKVILIGDRIHDVEGARAHGIEVCLVKWGFGDEVEWTEADYLVDNPKQLETLLGL
jgi:phosphoglycolate phosphatase